MEQNQEQNQKQLNITHTILILWWKYSKIGRVCTIVNKVKKTYYYMGILCDVLIFKASSFWYVNILVTICTPVLNKTGSGGMFPLRQVHSMWLSAGLKEERAYACRWALRGRKMDESWSDAKEKYEMKGQTTRGKESYAEVHEIIEKRVLWC